MNKYLKISKNIFLQYFQTKVSVKTPLARFRQPYSKGKVIKINKILRSFI